MQVNSLKTSMRFLWRNKTFSILNILCMTFGLTCALISFLYILNICSSNRFNKNYRQLYAVDAYVTYFNGDRFPKEYLSAGLSDLLKEQAPEIQDITRTKECSHTIVNAEKSFSQEGLYADNNFFSVFTFPFLAKESSALLSDPNAIYISERLAVKIFGNIDCIGKGLVLKDEVKQESFRIAGIFYNTPSNSSLRFDYVVPFSKFIAGNSWALDQGATANQTWIVLNPNTDYRAVENKIRNLIKDNESTLNQELFLFPLREQPLYSYAAGRRVWKEMQNVIIAGAVGLVILLIACFNFINLSIILNFRRYTEAGIKKVVGSGKWSIARQFLGETLILVLISFAASVLVSKVLLIGLNRITQAGISLHFNVAMIIFLIAVIIFTCLVAGLMPALYMASQNPIDVLKSKKPVSHSFSFFRQCLIIFQFTIPVVLIIYMMIITTQDRYMRSYDVGVDQDRLIILNNTSGISEHAASVKADLMSLTGIEAVSFTNCIPARGARVTNEISWEGKDPTEKLHFWYISSDIDYNKTVRLNLTDGRYFEPSFSSDTTAYLINDVAAGVMKNGNPVGSVISVNGNKGTIIGVFKDFHAIDLAGPVVPAIISIRPAEREYMLIKLAAASYSSVIGEIIKICKTYEIEDPVNATLYRDLIPYSNLSLPSSIAGVAFIIALLLACLGFYGLASFTAESRTKEIGIRKANGATTLSLIWLLLANYSRWLLISVIIAVPVTFVLGRAFLGRFYFHAPMPVLPFIAGPAAAISVALLTVLLQTWSVAGRNPVKSLRYE